MTPDRLRQFIYKAPAQGRALSLLADQGLGSTLVVVTYTREECEASADPSGGQPDLVEEIQQAAIDHCDAVGEPTRFQIAWFNAENRMIKSSPHSAAPSEKPGLHRGDYAGTEPISANRVVGELLSALTQKDKTLNASFGVVLLAYEKALSMQQRTIDTLAKLTQDLSDEAAKVTRKAHLPAPRSEQEIEAELRTAELKQQALQKLIEHGPDLLSSALRAAVAAAGREGMQ